MGNDGGYLKKIMSRFIIFVYKVKFIVHCFFRAWDNFTIYIIGF